MTDTGNGVGSADEMAELVRDLNEARMELQLVNMVVDGLRVEQGETEQLVANLQASCRVYIDREVAAARAAASKPVSVSVIFDGPPGPVCGRFVEVETDDGHNVNIGEWVDRADGLWALRFTQDMFGAVPTVPRIEGCTNPKHDMPNGPDELDPGPDGLDPRYGWQIERDAFEAMHAEVVKQRDTFQAQRDKAEADLAKLRKFVTTTHIAELGSLADMLPELQLPKRTDAPTWAQVSALQAERDAAVTQLGKANDVMHVTQQALQLQGEAVGHLTKGLRTYMEHAADMQRQVDAVAADTAQQATEVGDSHEPGEPIVAVTCPCCGALLQVEYGDDEGEIAVIGRADVQSKLLQPRKCKGCINPPGCDGCTAPCRLDCGSDDCGSEACLAIAGCDHPDAHSMQDTQQAPACTSAFHEGGQNMLDRCAYCGKQAEGEFSIHRDDFDEGPEVPLCNACGGPCPLTLGATSPTLEQIWWRISTKHRRFDGPDTGADVADLPSLELALQLYLPGVGDRAGQLLAVCATRQQFALEALRQISPGTLFGLRELADILARQLQAGLAADCAGNGHVAQVVQEALDAYVMQQAVRAPTA